MLQTPTILWRKISKRIFGNITLRPKTKPKGRVLVSYILDPFLLYPGQKLSTRHSNYFECKTIVEYFLHKGYIVDVISTQNDVFIPRKKYKFVLDIGNNLERFEKHLSPECIVFHHITTSYWKFNNTAEFLRLGAFKQRNNTYLKPRRGLKESRNFEIAHHVFGFGNSHTQSTYPEGKPITLIPQSLPIKFELPKRDWQNARNTFLWLSGGGAVHKGLDLLLETFRERSDLTLHVCGPVTAEEDFVDFYHKELFETSNIKYHGRINIESERFKQIYTESGFVIYPSCSEGQSGAVLVSMSTGLIPIISKESGVDIDNSGFLLEKSSLEELNQALKWTTNLSEAELQNMSQKVYTETNHTYGQDQFKKAITEYFDTYVQ